MTNIRYESCAIDKSVPSEHKNNVPCFTEGYSQLNVYDWLANIPLPPNQKTFNIIEVKFKGARKDFYLNPENISLKNTDMVIVKAMGGHDTGQMAESFNIRIEMRQISMLEEASRLGGIGTCGREFCYSAWLTDFRTGVAFYGRNNDKQWSEFKCCLTQEPQNYKASLKDTDLNSIETLKGIATLQKKDVDKRIMWFSYPNDKHWIPVKFSWVKEIKTLIKEGMILKRFNGGGCRNRETK